MVLSQIIDKILDINKNRKRLSYRDNRSQAASDFEEELRLLNKMAKKQAMLIQHYEAVLAGQEHRLPHLRGR